MKNTAHIKRTMAFIFFALISFTLTAQKPPRMGEGRERIEAMKTAFLTRKMQLTKEEARDFWPVFDAYQEKMKLITQERIENSVDAPDHLMNMSDEEINAMIDTRLNNAEQAIALRKQLVEDLREKLPPAKIALFMQAEHQFNRELQQRLNQRRGDRQDSRR